MRYLAWGVATILGLSGGLSGCQTSGVMSERPVDPGLASVPVTHGPAANVPARQDVFTRERRPVITEVQRDPDGTGSLFPIDDPRNNLIVQNPLRPGMILDVKVITTRTTADSGKNQKSSGQKGPANDKQMGAEGLPGALPKLEPAAPEAAPLKSIKMRLESILPNGDGIVSVSRSSRREGDFREVYAKARIPADRMIPGAQLATSDLFDVSWSDFDGSMSTERRSTAWEDEYSLRLSGFEELRSKEALAVEEGRRQVVAEKEKLAEESRKFSDERSRSAKQRDELQQKLRDAEAKISELQKGAPPEAKGAALAPTVPADAAKGGGDDKKK